MPNCGARRPRRQKENEQSEITIAPENNYSLRRETLSLQRSTLHRISLMLLVVKEVLHFHCKVCKRFGIFYFNVSKISNITKRVPLIQFRQPPNLGKWRHIRKRAIITSQPFHFLRSCIPNTRTRSPLYSSTCVNFVAEIVLMFPRKKKKMS